MRFLYDWTFWKSYLCELVWNFFSLALMLLGVNELSGWFFQTSLHWIHKHRGKIALILVFLAQASVFYSLKQSQSLGDTRQKFDVADVEGRKQISSLKKQVANAQERDAEKTKHEWPPLTDQQISEWTKALAPSRGTTEVMHVIWAQDVEAKKLFRSLQKVGKAVGISVQNWGGSADGNNIEVRDLHGGVGKALVLPDTLTVCAMVAGEAFFGGQSDLRRIGIALGLGIPCYFALVCALALQGSERIWLFKSASAMWMPGLGTKARAPL